MDPDKALAMAKKMGADSASLHKMEEAMKRHATSSQPAGGGMAAMMKQMMQRKEYTKEQIARATAIMEVERAVKNVNRYRTALPESPAKELESMMNALPEAIRSLRPEATR